MPSVGETGSSRSLCCDRKRCAGPALLSLHPRRKLDVKLFSERLVSTRQHGTVGPGAASGGRCGSHPCRRPALARSSPRAAPTEIPHAWEGVPGAEGRRGPPPTLAASGAGPRRPAPPTPGVAPSRSEDCPPASRRRPAGLGSHCRRAVAARPAPFGSPRPLQSPIKPFREPRKDLPSVAALPPSERAAEEGGAQERAVVRAQCRSRGE